MSDNEFAERMMKARSHLLEHVSGWAERVARGYCLPTPPTLSQEQMDSLKKRIVFSHLHAHFSIRKDSVVLFRAQNQRDFNTSNL
jgi:hypothetical protein